MLSEIYPIFYIFLTKSVLDSEPEDTSIIGNSIEGIIIATTVPKYIMAVIHKILLLV